MQLHLILFTFHKILQTKLWVGKPQRKIQIAKSFSPLPFGTLPLKCFNLGNATKFFKWRKRTHTPMADSRTP